jgi:hypothetical protein
MLRQRETTVYFLEPHALHTRHGCHKAHYNQLLHYYIDSANRQAAILRTKDSSIKCYHMHCCTYRLRLALGATTGFTLITPLG